MGPMIDVADVSAALYVNGYPARVISLISVRPRLAMSETAVPLMPANSIAATTLM